VHGRSNARVCLASLYAVRLDSKTLNLGLIIRDVSSYKLETVGHFSSLMTEDFNAILSSITGSFNVTLDNLPETHSAIQRERHTVDPPPPGSGRERWTSPDRP
jgi:hypothetical protein